MGCGSIQENAVHRLRSVSYSILNISLGLSHYASALTFLKILRCLKEKPQMGFYAAISLQKATKFRLSDYNRSILWACYIYGIYDDYNGFSIVTHLCVLFFWMTCCSNNGNYASIVDSCANKRRSSTFELVCPVLGTFEAKRQRQTKKTRFPYTHMMHIRWWEMADVCHPFRLSLLILLFLDAWAHLYYAVTVST